MIRRRTADEPLVTHSDDRVWGAPVFAGTRVPVDTLFENLEAGETLEEFLRQFPTVTRRQAIGALELTGTLEWGEEYDYKAERSRG